jgi:hypothetical protein
MTQMCTQSPYQATQKMQVLTVTDDTMKIRAKAASYAQSFLANKYYEEYKDDVAFHDECDECGNFIHTCICEQEDPDRMHDEMHED